VSTVQQEKAAAFRRLHDGEPFVIPNPWDAGSARVPEALGFRAEVAGADQGLARGPIRKFRVRRCPAAALIHLAAP
jgi:hypothetical protein